MKSKPSKAEEYENKIIKNKIEIESLRTDKEGSKNRIDELETENKCLKKSLDIILKEWGFYEEKINSLNSLKEDLENKAELKNAGRIGDLNLAGNLLTLSSQI